MSDEQKKVQLNSKPITISAVVITYNMCDLLERALKSVAAQTRPVDEIIVVDDGSTDGTAEMMKGYPHIQYIYQDNAGPSAARNTGIKAATKEWIAFLDGDDEWVAEKTKMQVERLNRYPELVWSSGNYYHRFHDLSQQFVYFTSNDIKKLELTDNPTPLYFDIVRQGHDIGLCNYMIRKDIILNAGCFQTGLDYGEDIDLWWRIAYDNPWIAFHLEPLTICSTRRPGSLTNATPREEKAEALYHIFSRQLKLAEEKNQTTKVLPFIKHRLKNFIELVYSKKQYSVALGISKQFNEIISPRYLRTLRLMTKLPKRLARLGVYVLKLTQL